MVIFHSYVKLPEGNFYLRCVFSCCLRQQVSILKDGFKMFQVSSPWMMILCRLHMAHMAHMALSHTRDTSEPL